MPKQYLVSKLLAPWLEASSIKALTSRQGLGQLCSNCSSIACQAERCLTHIALPGSHVSQDELDAAAPLGRLPKVKLPIQPAQTQPYYNGSFSLLGYSHSELASSACWDKVRSPIQPPRAQPRCNCQMSRQGQICRSLPIKLQGRSQALYQAEGTATELPVSTKTVAKQAVRLGAM